MYPTSTVIVFSSCITTSRSTTTTSNNNNNNNNTSTNTANISLSLSLFHSLYLSPLLKYIHTPSGFLGLVKMEPSSTPGLRICCNLIFYSTYNSWKKEHIMIRMPKKVNSDDR